ncbi:hypothetical protein J8TS2_22980 [Lederbergia ruris]|uniref:Uncharacterized protein n=1 Tax=Lederbergia ruris TaxID=217495 RepID=A0ABQ4KJ40_9BACI|nr:hypothetical protein J8TS2_22980 [Lederbergia ruris]
MTPTIHHKGITPFSIVSLSVIHYGTDLYSLFRFKVHCAILVEALHETGLSQNAFNE